MLPLLATLAPLVVALVAAADAALDTGVTSAAVETGEVTRMVPLPEFSKDSPENATALEVFCLDQEKRFHFRISHAPDALTERSRLAVVCEPHRMQQTDYEALFEMRPRLRLGVTHTVVLHQCPLPAGRLRHFLQRLGVHGVRNVRVVSLPMLNDTMHADFLEGIDLETLNLGGLTHIELHDDFLASARDLHNLTITGTGTNASLPEGLLRHTPQLRKLNIRNLNVGRLPITFLHGLHNLTKLLASKIGLRELTREHFRDLGQLRHLELYKNQLHTLPEDVFSSQTQLEVVRMECNPFRALPEPLFASTPGLKLLRINGKLNANADVPSLPEGIFRGLSKLELLMLDRFGLQRLPPGLFRGLAALQNLTLDHNELTELPDGIFSELSGLLNLDLSHNQLRDLRPVLLHGLVSMDTLYLNGNGLEGLPNEMFTHTPRLQRLFLHDNNLTALLDLTFFGLHSNLRELDLSNNSLQFGSHEPAFSFVRELVNLNMRRNRIRTIPEEIRLNLIKLQRVDLMYNELQSLNMGTLNFLSSGAEISMMYNNISFIDVHWVPTKKVKRNKIYVGKNPLICDCSAIWLNAFMSRTIKSQQAEDLGPPFLLMTEGLQCAVPQALAGRTFSKVHADELKCPAPDGCPVNCSCTLQPSRHMLLTSCEWLPTRLPDPESTDYSVSLRVVDKGLRGLGNASWPANQLANLDLSHNTISKLTPALLPEGLRELRLVNNSVSHVGESFLERLDAASNNATRVWLSHNPFVCDCELLPLHQYLQLHLSGNSLRIEDADQMTCVGGERKNLLELTSGQLCPSRTAIIVTVCVVAFAVILCLLVVLCVYYRHGEMLKVWLYSHNLCLWFVTEEELDADKKYDAFISYSHLDEQFVVEKLVPELESGEPRYELCLHFRDWLAGEWITDQIQRSVEDSRRVIVIMSNNFIQSEWGRLEFLAAHKQALEDKRNRVIVVVYGDLPDPSTMDPELRLYISMNTYLEWGDAHFWQRLRYALPHKGRRLKQGRGRHPEKLSMVSLGNGTCLPTVNGAALPSSKEVHTDATAPSPTKVSNGNLNPAFDQMV